MYLRDLFLLFLGDVGLLRHRFKRKFKSLLTLPEIGANIHCVSKNWDPYTHINNYVIFCFNGISFLPH